MPSYTTPYARTPYEPRSYDYRPGRLSDLILMQGRSQADAERQRGAASAAMWLGVGNAASQAISSYGQYKMDEPRREAEKVQREAAALQLKETKRTLDERDAINRIKAAGGTGEEVAKNLRQFGYGEAAEQYESQQTRKRADALSLAASERAEAGEKLREGLRIFDTVLGKGTKEEQAAEYAKHLARVRELAGKDIPFPDTYDPDQVRAVVERVRPIHDKVALQNLAIGQLELTTKQGLSTLQVQQARQEALLKYFATADTPAEWAEAVQLARNAGLDKELALVGDFQIGKSDDIMQRLTLGRTDVEQQYWNSIRAGNNGKPLTRGQIVAGMTELAKAAAAGRTTGALTQAGLNTAIRWRHTAEKDARERATAGELDANQYQAELEDIDAMFSAMAGGGGTASPRLTREFPAGQPVGAPGQRPSMETPTAVPPEENAPADVVLPRVSGTPPSAAPPGMVLMESPDGRQKQIVRQDEVEALIAEGARVVPSAQPAQAAQAAQSAQPAPVASRTPRAPAAAVSPVTPVAAAPRAPLSQAVMMPGTGMTGGRVSPPAMLPGAGGPMAQAPPAMAAPMSAPPPRSLAAAAQPVPPTAAPPPPPAGPPPPMGQGGNELVLMQSPDGRRGWATAADVPAMLEARWIVLDTNQPVRSPRQSSFAERAAAGREATYGPIRDELAAAWRRFVRDLKK